MGSAGGDRDGRRTGFACVSLRDTPFWNILIFLIFVKEKVSIFYDRSGSLAPRSSGGFEDSNKTQGEGSKKRKVDVEK